MTSEAAGFILSTGDSVVAGTPFKNIEFLREYASKYEKSGVSYE